jgi:hypothetical protein
MQSLRERNLAVLQPKVKKTKVAFDCGFNLHVM